MELLRKAENLTEAYVLLDPNRPLEGAWFINDFCPLYGEGSASFELRMMSGIYRCFGGQIRHAITHLDVVSPPVT